MPDIVPSATSPDDIFAKIVPGGFCIGCGNCAFASGGSVTMAINDEGYVQAAPVVPGAQPPIELCPFSNAVPDETAIAATQPWGELPADPLTGRYGDLYAGHVVDEAYRFAGGSGGITSWFLQELLASGEVDHVIHVKPVDPVIDRQGRLFRYAMSSDMVGLSEGRKSRYYPVDLADVYALIKRQPGRYAIVAIPCFAKAIRLMQAHDSAIGERVRFVVGLVCGHLKSKAFGEYLGWLQGVRPDDLRAIDFRVKIPGEDASRYTVEARSDHEVKRGAPLKEYFGTTWDLGFMKYAACEYCDDVFAETADIVLGDAWIRPFQDSWLGSNVVLTRHPVASRLIAAGAADGRLDLTPIPLDQMIKSQASGLRHRREGLAYRLKLTDATGRWRPRKRYEIAPEPGEARKAVYRMRMHLATVSAKRFAGSRKAPSVAVFEGRISADVFRYYLKAGGLKPAVFQSAPMKWLRRKLKG